MVARYRCFYKQRWKSLFPPLFVTLTVTFTSSPSPRHLHLVTFTSSPSSRHPHLVTIISSPSLRHLFPVPRYNDLSYTDELSQCPSSIAKSTHTKQTRRNGPGTRCRTGRLTSPATRWSRRWTRSASTAQSLSHPLRCIATTRATRSKCKRRIPAVSRS